jgi:hypothetical protein
MVHRGAHRQGVKASVSHRPTRFTINCNCTMLSGSKRRFENLRQRSIGEPNSSVEFLNTTFLQTTMESYAAQPLASSGQHLVAWNSLSYQQRQA